MEDKEILELAQKEGLILLTNDKDFGELVFRQKCLNNGIILFRVKGEDSRQKSILIRKLLMGHWDKIHKHFVVITKKKFRFIPIEGV